MHKLFAWRLLAAPIVISLALAACGGVDPNQVICKRNPAAVKVGDPVCRPNVEGSINNDEFRTPAVVVGNQQKAIYYGYVEDTRPEILDTIGAHPYPASQSIPLPLQVQDFRTDSNPNGEFCAGQKPRCIAPMSGVTLEYTSADGQIRTIEGITINLQGSLRFVVEESTALAWLRLDRTRTQEDFWYKFWDAVRVPKIVSITGFSVDPVSDQWGEKTNQAIAAVLTARAVYWEFAPLISLTDGVIQVKSVDAPTVPGAITGGNIDAQATQNAIQLGQAEAFATQRAVVCEGIDDDVACALLMQTYAGNSQSPVTVQVYPADASATPAP
ncbi:MAG: hypothetical protein AAB548_03090 [Patescibacteria group bacterium]